jgi:hypothetical protein
VLESLGGDGRHNATLVTMEELGMGHAEVGPFYYYNSA